MRYTLDIERNIDALEYCLRKVKNGMEDIWSWDISINAGGIEYGIYFNFDTKRKELEICNCPGYGYNDTLYLDEIIDKINEEEYEDNNK